MAGRLEETPYAEEAAALVLGIKQKVQEILKRQEDSAVKPREHIRAYRLGITVITTIEQDLSALERLKQEALTKGFFLDSGDSDSRIAVGAGSGGPPEGGAPLGRSISMTTAWQIIFAILAFLAVLSVIFFMTWHRRLGFTKEGEQQAVPLPTGSQGVKRAEEKFEGPQPG
jgi:hypothetical protein